MAIRVKEPVLEKVMDVMQPSYVETGICTIPSPYIYFDIGLLSLDISDTARKIAYSEPSSSAVHRLQMFKPSSFWVFLRLFAPCEAKRKKALTGGHSQRWTSACIEITCLHHQ